MRKYKSARWDLDSNGPGAWSGLAPALHLGQPEENFQGVANRAIGQGLMTSAEDTLQANYLASQQIHTGQSATPMPQTGGFDVWHKNAT